MITLHRIITRIIKEVEGNNWLKVLFDKGFRYFFTIAVLWYVSGQLQIVNDALLIVAFTMPVIDIIAFDLIDKYRKPKPIPKDLMKMLNKLGYVTQLDKIPKKYCRCGMCNDGMACCQCNLPHQCNFRGADWNK